MSLNLALRLGGVAAAAAGGAPPTFIASTSAETSSTSLTITTPSGSNSSSFLVALVAIDGTGETFSTPSGWTLVSSNTGSAPWAYCFARVHDGSSPSYTFTKSAAVVTAGGTILSYSGCSGIDVSAQSSAFTNNATAPTITTSVADTRLMFVWFMGTNDAAATPPSGWTQRLDRSAGSWYMEAWDKDAAQGIGATGAISAATNWGGSRSWSGVHIALKA